PPAFLRAAWSCLIFARILAFVAASVSTLNKDWYAPSATLLFWKCSAACARLKYESAPGATFATFWNVTTAFLDAFEYFVVAAWTLEEPLVLPACVIGSVPSA